MSELVKELRENIARQRACKYPSEAEFNDELMQRAADEIERLQAEIQQWQDAELYKYDKR